MKEYDKGNSEQALVISKSLRTLLYDTGNSESILKQLGIKDKLYLVSTAFLLNADGVMHIVQKHTSIKKEKKLEKNMSKKNGCNLKSF